MQKVTYWYTTKPVTNKVKIAGQKPAYVYCHATNMSEWVFADCHI